MVIFKDIEVSIYADGEPLGERQDMTMEEDDVDKTTRYIEARSGQVFEIHMRTPSVDQFEGDIICYDIYVDGRLLDSLLLQKGSPILEEVSKGLEMPDGTVRPFQFSEVAIKEHDPTTRAKRDRNEHREVGKITVKVHHKNRGETSNLYVDPRGWTAIDAVDEKALKGQAVSHSVGLAPAVEAKGSSSYCQSSFVDPDRVPFAELTFLYRSAENLASIFIPTPTASPEPEEDLVDRDPRVLTVAQISEVQRRAREAPPILELIRGIKRERTEDDTQDGPLRRSRRPIVSTYMAPRNGDDDQGFEEVDGPVRPSQPSVQLD